MELDNFLAYLKEDLKKERTFIINPKRETEFSNSYNALKELLKRESINATIECERGELINGYAVIKIKADWIAVREIEKFHAAVVNADNFETFADGDQVQINVMFHNVMTRI